MIDPTLKRCLGQMMHGVQVVGAAHEGQVNAYCSHWVTQVSFGEPIVMASASPRHDTFPLIEASGRFSVSMLAADQVTEGQYFSYPGRKFHHIAAEYLTLTDEGLPLVPNNIAWLACEVFERIPMQDHVLFFARVTAVRPGRLREPPLLYSSRLGWRMAGDRAREPGSSVRDTLLARLAGAGYDTADAGGDDPED